MLSTLVKISNVTNLSDARYCTGMGVEWLGFSVDEEDVNYVSPKNFREIKSWLAGVRMIAETSKSTLEEILKTIEDYEVDGIQVSVKVSASELSHVSGKNVFIRLDIDEYTPDDILAIMADNPAEIYVLESSTEQNLAEEWKQVIAYAGRTNKILLGFGLDDPDTIQSLLDSLELAGLALKGSEEIRPGFKDFGGLMDILEALEEEN
jgi:phosphoribosylanthranilate isomerase